MTEKEFLKAVLEYIEQTECYGNGYIKRNYYRDLKDILHDGEMPTIWYACKKRLEKL